MCFLALSLCFECSSFISGSFNQRFIECLKLSSEKSVSVLRLDGFVVTLAAQFDHKKKKKFHFCLKCC